MSHQDYDSLLSSVGPLGPWHWLVLLALVPPALLPGMWSVLFVFSGYVVPHRCRVPGCDGPHSQYQQPWLHFTTPSEDDIWDSCAMFSQINGTGGGEGRCEAEMFVNRTEECQDFVWDTSVFTSTVVTEWDLVCDGNRGQFMVDLGYTMTSVGVFLGVLIPGYFSDRFGRKKMMFFAMLVAAVSTLVSAFVPTYTSFLVVRVFSGFGTLGTFVTMCIMAVEITSVQHKSLVGNLVHILWAPGQMVMALMAYFIRDWRHLHIAVSVPIFLSLLLYPLTPESPRWLLAVGRKKEAEKIIRQMARLNNKPEPSLHSQTELTDKQENIRLHQEKEKVSALTLISRPGIALTTVILGLNWLVVDLCYYGLSLNSVNLAGNLFTNFVLSAAVEIPAVVLGMLGMDWLGRVTLLFLCQVVGGVSCILAGLLQPPYVLPLSLVGKFSSSVVFLIVYLYTAEIYPTKLRGMGLALTATMARIGGFIAPYISGIGVTSSHTPFLIFGGSALLGGLSATFLPETRGEKLPETIEEVEEIVLRRAKTCFKTTEATDL